MRCSDRFSAMDYRGDEEAPLVSSEDQKLRAGKSYTRDVHILSISFLLIFLAYGAAQNLETTVNKVPDLSILHFSQFAYRSLLCCLFSGKSARNGIEGKHKF